jgi:hypothetical protein
MGRARASTEDKGKSIQVNQFRSRVRVMLTPSYPKYIKRGSSEPGKAGKPTTTHTKHYQISQTAITPFKGFVLFAFVVVVKFLMG